MCTDVNVLVYLKKAKLNLWGHALGADLDHFLCNGSRDLKYSIRTVRLQQVTLIKQSSISCNIPGKLAISIAPTTVSS